MKGLVTMLCLLALPVYAGETTRLADALAGDWQGATLQQTIRAVAAPALGETVLYLQMNAVGEHRVTRQRLFILEPTADGGVAMHFPALKEAGRFVDGWRQPDLFAALTAEDLVAYPESCAVRWTAKERQWTGTLDGDRCTIISRHTGETRIIRAFFGLTDSTLEQVEQGYDGDGNRLFGDDDPYRFTRVSPAR
jgi:hypothetical protein